MKDKQIKLFAKRVLFTLMATFTFSNAQMIDALALTVNDEPITTNDINEKMAETNLKKADAVSALIDEILYKQELEKQNITVDIFEVNDYLEKLAASNGMDLYTFKSILRQKNKDFDKFEERTKKEILKRKLAEKLVRGNIPVATQEDLKIYYDNNQAMFTTAAKINVTQYASKNKRSLITISQNPMALLNDVVKKDFTLEQDKLNPQLKFLLNDTKDGTFTPIFTADRTFVMFFVKSKSGVTTLKFDDVKEKIFNALMGEREQKFLKEYFEKLKLTADIKVIR
ncbi:SurA N-terminal domain-containing protein [Arcobacter sp. KX21116]|jgi:parvulin-like peptidyl-prolyl isomerase|uniref:peptidylprolyl isomerase n=1 Tax=Arcobacter iocasae TaxID=2906515 RepID=UPI0035D41E64